MDDKPSKRFTAFEGAHHLASGSLIEVALAVKRAAEANPHGTLLTFDDTTGAVVDLDLRGSTADIAARLTETMPPRPRGRPKLGVVAREVTLLPRHWDWLARQPGGASQALRRLVDDARRADGGRTETRAAQATTYAFMAAIAGDLAGFEDATRALFASDHDSFATHTASWPPDIRSHAQALMAESTR